MDFIKIKNMVRQNGDKFVFVENGEPEAVMMSFQEYEKLAKGNGRSLPHDAKVRFRGYGVRTADLWPESFSETEFLPSSGAETSNLPARLEDIHLEDLPI